MAMFLAFMGAEHTKVGDLTRTRFPPAFLMLLDRRHQARGVHQLAVGQHVVGMRQVMQRKGGLHGAHPALGVLGGIDRLLGELQREERLLGDALGHGQAEGFSSARGTTWFTMPSRCASAPDPVGGEQKLLGLAHAEFPGMGEEFRAAHAHRHRVVEELGVLGGHDQVARPDRRRAARDHLALHQRHGRLGDVAPALAEADVDLLLAGVLRLGARLAEARPRTHRLVLAHVAVAVTSRRSWPEEKCGPLADSTITLIGRPARRGRRHR